MYTLMRIVCVACRGGRGNKGAHGRVVPPMRESARSRHCPWKRPPLHAVNGISLRPRVTRPRIASAPRGSVGARVLEHERGNAALRGAVAAGARWS